MHISTWLPHWLDIIALVTLGWGFQRGRRHGISGELLYLLQWIAIVIVSGIFHRNAGERLAHWMHISPNTGRVMVYIILAFVVKGVFNVIHRAVGNKLVSRDFFGKTEYYLGMITGMGRMACILVAALALLSAKYVTDEDLYSLEVFQKENFGGITFPTLSEMKHDSLTKSVFGRTANRWAGGFFIAAVPPETETPSYSSPREGSEKKEAAEDWQMPENQTRRANN